MTKLMPISKCVGRKPQRIARVIRPFPGVAEIGVPVDQHHQAAVVVEDAAQVRGITVVFVGRPAGVGAPAEAEVGHLHDPVDVVKDVEHGVFGRYLDDGVVGQHLLHLRD